MFLPNDENDERDLNENIKYEEEITIMNLKTMMNINVEYAEKHFELPPLISEDLINKITPAFKDPF